MRGRLVALAVAVLTPAAAFAQHFHHHLEAAPEDAKRVSVCDKPYATPDPDPRLPKVRWEVTSRSDKAKELYKQGMALYYGFNFEDALRHFREATNLDDKFVMGWWGMALAAGPNINLGIDSTCMSLARQWSRRARDLALNQEKSLTPVEVDLAQALRARYGNSGLQPKAYALAMERVWAKRKPHAEVGALYAESLMDLHPWALYDRDHRDTSPDTKKVLDALADVLRADANAVGANHLYIHAVEAGPTPALARTSADFLSREAGSSGHLQHMPSHTYLLMGEYGKAADANSKAIPEDNTPFEAVCMGDYRTYTKEPKCLQLYYGHYGAHNYFFRGVAEAFRGHYNAALDDADRTFEHARHFINNEPGLQRYMTAPLMFYAAFGGWDPIIAMKEEPPETCYIQPPFTEESGCRILRAMWRWAHGMAFARKAPVAQAARDELAKFRTERALVKRQGPDRWGNNAADDVLEIADKLLLARIDWAEDHKPSAIANLKLAVAAEDALVYDEPPQFIYPMRQALGGAYLAFGDYKSARDVFAADLERHQENGRALYGMWKALDHIPDQKALAEQYRLRYKAAWLDQGGKDLTEDLLWPVGML
jgi:tetratricopeptide (TPR) repeat protein